MPIPSVVFGATGEIQTYVVPISGGYLIEACGAEAAADDAGGVRGDYVKGMFYLNRGDILKIVVGSRQPARAALRMTCAGEGGTIVWRGAGELPLPARLMLAAGSGASTQAGPHDNGWGESFNAGAFQENAPNVNRGDGYVAITAMDPMPSLTPSSPQPVSAATQ
jgi:hypothetical protein